MLIVLTCIRLKKMDPLLHAVCQFVETAEHYFKVRRVFHLDSTYIQPAIQLQTKLFSCVYQINKLSDSVLGFHMYRYVDSKSDNWKNEVWKLWYSHRSLTRMA